MIDWSASICLTLGDRVEVLFGIVAIIEGNTTIEKEVCEIKEVKNNTIYFCEEGSNNNCGNVNIYKSLEEPIRFLDFWCHGAKLKCQGDTCWDNLNNAQSNNKGYDYLLYKCDSYTIEVIK
jgi:hypothetical protein